MRGARSPTGCFTKANDAIHAPALTSSHGDEQDTWERVGRGT